MKQHQRMVQVRARRWSNHNGAGVSILKEWSNRVRVWLCWGIKNGPAWMEQGRLGIKNEQPATEWKQSFQSDTFPSKEWVWGTNYLCKHLQNVHRVNIQQTKRKMSSKTTHRKNVSTLVSVGHQSRPKRESELHMKKKKATSTNEPLSMISVKSMRRKVDEFERKEKSSKE